MDIDPHPRRSHAQSEEHRSRSAARQPDRDHGTVGLRQVLARVRHDLCRRPAPLRRIAVGVCAAVPVGDGKARRRSHRRPVARRSRSSRNRPRTIRARRSARSPRSTTTCACCSRASARRAVRITAFRCEAQTVSQMVDAALALNPETRFMLLAPVIRERKGEHVQVFEQLRAQGFVRARVDGVLYELDAVPPLALRQKHTIEAVIDRFRPRADIKQRLAESFETALRLGDGIAIARRPGRPTKRRRRLFSSRFSCPICDYSLPELEPRLFSFNSPVGACRTCDGLGVTQVFDPARVVVHPNLSLAAGAVRGWDRRNMYYFQLILSLARTTSSTSTRRGNSCPRRSATRFCPAPATRSDHVPLSHRNRRQRHAQASLRRHRAESGAPLQAKPNRRRCARNWRSSSASGRAPIATAQRLNRSARNVFVGDASLPKLTALPIDQTLAVLQGAASSPAGAARSRRRSSRKSASACASSSTSASII